MNTEISNATPQEEQWDMIIQPQRSLLESIILEEIQRVQAGDVIILRGMPGETVESPSLPGVKMISHLPDDELAGLIRGAKIIICRPGYSTLMDLAVIGRSAVLVPTPGQTEHLGKFSRGNGIFRTISLLKQEQSSASVA